MARSIFAGAVFALLAGAAPVAWAQYGPAPYGGGGGPVVRCESGEGRQQFCPADTRGGVQLSRQLSRTPCVEGTSWGVQRGGIWVDRGCRGEFVTGYDGRYPGGGYEGGYGEGDGRELIRCESRDGRWRQCAVDARRVELVRQMSETPCIRGRTWGVDRGGIWVSGGCRAEFRAAGGWEGGEGWGQGGGSPQMVRCESGDNRRRMCPVTIRGDARLVRQFSRSPCIEGDTWGFSRDGLWVDRGCRGEFHVTQRRGRRDG